MSNLLDNLNDVLNFAESLARMVGTKVAEAFNQAKVVNLKSCSTDLVTETDQEVEAIIIKEIKKTYPEHRYIGEESVAGGQKCELTADPTWIIDPIDGTTNFVHRYPYVAVCLGFCINKVRQVGVVYNPVTDEMFSAVRGHGSYCNGKPLHVSNQNDLKHSLIMAEFGSSRDTEHLDVVFKNLRSIIETPVHSIHSMGSAALNICAVASGQAEAYYEFGIHCWDYCAASLILEEAGGVAVDTTGSNLDLMARRLIAACNMDIASCLSSKLIQVDLPRD